SYGPGSPEDNGGSSPLSTATQCGLTLSAGGPVAGRREEYGRARVACDGRGNASDTLAPALVFAVRAEHDQVHIVLAGDAQYAGSSIVLVDHVLDDVERVTAAGARTGVLDLSVQLVTRIVTGSSFADVDDLDFRGLASTGRDAQRG